jgi:hypothetical protein
MRRRTSLLFDGSDQLVDMAMVLESPVALVVGAGGLDTSLDSLEGHTHYQWLKLIAAAEEQGITVRVRSTRRTCAQQNGLYAIGRSEGDTRKVVTKARGCISWHVAGRAIDVDMLTGTFHQLGALAKSMGWKWGGDFPGFPDWGHFEWHPNLTIEQNCPDPSRCTDTDVDTTMPTDDTPVSIEKTSDAPDEAAAEESPSLVGPIVLASVLVGSAILWTRL